MRTDGQVVRCYRHGESEANAGLSTHDPMTIGLTARGLAQAKEIASSMPWSPDLIVSSPALRARLTAAPTQTRFPGVRSAVWPIQEFTYLSPRRCANTSIATRRPWVDAYWRQADPHYVDGDGAESFADFIARVRTFGDLLASARISGARRVAVFGHGQFLQAVRCMPIVAGSDTASIDMRAFRALDEGAPIENAELRVLELWRARQEGNRGDWALSPASPSHCCTCSDVRIQSFSPISKAGTDLCR